MRSRRNEKAGREPAGQQPEEAYLQHEALPDYLQDNEYIQEYYRRPGMPIGKSLMSIFGLHNETGNIYTHLVGFILFVCLTVYMAYEPPTPLAFGHLQVNTLWSELNGRMHQLPESLSGGLHQLTEAARGLSPGLQQFQHGISERMHTLQEGLSERLHGLQEGIQERVHQVSEEITERVHDLQEGFQERVHQISEAAASQYLYDSLAGLLCWPTARWPTFVYMGGAMTCLLLSAVCHLMGCCQKHISQMVWRFDYAGIAVLIVTSFYPVVYYGFLCHKPYLAFYLVSTTMLGIGAVMVSLMDCFQERAWRAVRASMFTALGLYGIVPIVHQFMLNSHVPQVKLALNYDLLMGATYILGAIIYANRVPERWFPGKFDLFCHSHQIFHVAVVLGACIHYHAVKLMLEWRDASGGCAVPVTDGHVSNVLQQMRDMGHLFSIEEVWSRLHYYTHAHLTNLSQAGLGSSDVSAACSAAQF